MLLARVVEEKERKIECYERVIKINPSNHEAKIGLVRIKSPDKTLTVHEKLVYDVVGYGGSSSKGEYAILRRGADNKADTVTKGKREGIIADAFLADSNKNHREEIYIITQNPSQISDKKILRFEPEQR